MTKGPNGFTLVELVVALLIFGILAASGVSLLAFSVRAQAAASARLDDIAGERRLSALLNADLTQAQPRITRDENGQAIRAFEGTSGAEPGLVMSYVRSGWSNPDGAPRPSIQRIDIVFEDGRLERRAHAMVDGAEVSGTMLLAEDIEFVRMRYRDKGDWRAQWDEASLNSLPRAVELTIKRKRQPALLLAFLCGAAYP